MKIHAIVDEVNLKLLYFSIPEIEALDGEFKVTLIDTDFKCAFEDAYYNLETKEFYNKIK